MKHQGELSVWGFLVSTVVFVVFALVISSYFPLNALRSTPTVANERSRDMTSILVRLDRQEASIRELQRELGERNRPHK